MSSVTKTISNALVAETSRRRFAMQLGLGSAVLLLAACGGGGGSGGLSDEAAPESENLRAKFDEFQVGMTSQDVINVVGRSPDSQTPSSYTWQSAEGSLDAIFGRGFFPGATITAATWGSSRESLTRGFV